MLSHQQSKGHIVVGSLFWISFIHLVSLLAPLYFTWVGLATFIVMSCCTLGLGVTLGYHRLLSHRSFETLRIIRYILAFLGVLALQGGPIRWVATHRLHHKETDKPGDPHSPIQGFLWAHVIWTFYRHPELSTQDDLKHYAPDLYKDPFLRFLDRYCFLLYPGFALLAFGIGTVIGGWYLGLSIVLWGWALRTVYTWHVTWLVNSAAHIWGYQSHPSHDNSRNNWWVALLTFGEGWHNNHHAYPFSARMGLQWFEVDMSYWIVLLLEKTGLAWNVLRPKMTHRRVQKQGLST
jgi:sn-2 palmitoyl-lipid 9-desaturase